MKKVGPDKNQRDIKWRGNGFLLPSYEILTRNKLYFLKMKRNIKFRKKGKVKK
jgi:hypothetical protein